MYEDFSELIERYRPDPAPYVAMAAREVPKWLDELDLKPAPPHLRMGTHTLDHNEWFEIDELFEVEKLARQRLIDEQRQHVFNLLPSAEAAAEETLEMITAWLQERGRPTETTDTNPLAAAGQLVQDDLCLMVHRDGDWHLDGGILCFPSVWRLSEKLGKPTGQVHAPVDHYAEELSSKVDRFFDKLSPERSVWRRNLSLKPTNAMYLPVSKAEVTSGHIEVADDGCVGCRRRVRFCLVSEPRWPRSVCCSTAPTSPVTFWRCTARGTQSSVASRWRTPISPRACCPGLLESARNRLVQPNERIARATASTASARTASTGATTVIAPGTETATIASPSPVRWAGQIARAIPSCPLCARR
jgi:Protein of unknown function (DUF3445)